MVLTQKNVEDEHKKMNRVWGSDSPIKNGRKKNGDGARLYVNIVFDAQASLKNQKIALLVVLRGSFLGVIGTLLSNEFWYFLKTKVSFLLY